MPHFWLIVAVIFFSSLVQSTFSFGGALIALPLLAFVIDVKVATPLMTLLSCSIGAIVVLLNWRDIHLRNAWRLIVSACCGIPFGILFLVRVDIKIVKFVLAITVIFFTLLNLLHTQKYQLKRLDYSLLFGFVSGLFGGAYNISGPPVVLYGTLAQWSPATFRATLQSYAFFTNVFAIVGYAFSGTITLEVLTYYLVSLPIVAASIWLGGRLHQMIPGEQYAMYIRILLLLLGLNLLYSVIQ